MLINLPKASVQQWFHIAMLGFFTLNLPAQRILCAQTINQTSSAQPAHPALAFDVISVKPSKAAETGFHLGYTPNGISAQNISPLMMMRMAYGMLRSNDNLFLGMPAWARDQRFDMQAKVSDADATAYQKLSREGHNQMLQTVLVERFNLVACKETREGKVYTLEIAKGGPKLKRSDVSNGSQHSSRGHLSGEGVPMVGLAIFLTQQLGATVLDKTGLTGSYDITLDWSPDDAASAATPGSDNADRPWLFTAVEEQLGLKLVSAKGPVEYLIVDRIDHPSAN